MRWSTEAYAASPAGEVAYDDDGGPFGSGVSAVDDREHDAERDQAGHEPEREAARARIARGQLHAAPCGLTAETTAGQRSRAAARSSSSGGRPP